MTDHKHGAVVRAFTSSSVVLVRFQPGAMCGLSLLLVLALLRLLREFSYAGVLEFSSFHKNQQLQNPIGSFNNDDGDGADDAL